jgi:acylpyruvate hydrolase
MTFVTLYNNHLLISVLYQIVAIGRNYAAHAKELNNTVPKEPFFFLKPTSSYLPSGGQLEIPGGIVAHHEGTSLYGLNMTGADLCSLLQVELGLIIGKSGRDISQAHADIHVAGYGMFPAGLS